MTMLRETKEKIFIRSNYLMSVTIKNDILGNIGYWIVWDNIEDCGFLQIECNDTNGELRYFLRSPKVVFDLIKPGGLGRLMRSTKREILDEKAGFEIMVAAIQGNDPDLGKAMRKCREFPEDVIFSKFIGYEYEEGYRNI